MPQPENECKGTCAYHEDRGRLIKELGDTMTHVISPTLNQHKGYWKILLLILLSSLAAIFYMTNDIKQSVGEVKNSVVSISDDVNELKSVVAIGSVEHGYNEYRLDQHNEAIRNTEQRLRVLEINGHDRDEVR